MTGAERSDWTLREKIGQMVMCGFDGKQPTEGIRMLIRDYKLGGIIYFRRNIGSAQEVAVLSEELQAAAREVSDIPLWIGIDQEGGMVARIDRDVSLMPGGMALGAARSLDYARLAAKVSGLELRQMGININFAPCIDVNNNPANPVVGVRSYGEDPELVGWLGASAIEGYQGSGVSACAKHFPGHGDTVADSHHELPVVPHNKDRLEQIELKPFRRAVSSGIDVIMTAHVQFPAYEDNGCPATLSGTIIDGLLRKEMGFSGVIITDCLEMKAISETVGVGRGAVLAVKAGVDLVLVSHRLDRQIEVLEALYEAVRSGEIPEERIDRSVERVISAKRKRAGAWDTGEMDGIGSVLHRETAREICEHSVTLVKREQGSLPLRKDCPTMVVWPVVRTSSEVDEAIAQEVTLGGVLGAYLTDIREVVIGTEPTEEEIRKVVEEAEWGFGQIVVGTYNASFSPGQSRLVQELLLLGKAVVTAVALRNPYDVLAFPDIHGYVACYENRPEMLRAVAKVLVGELPAKGRLPVRLSDEYPYGFGLS
jgi:beta-N-acetylhexosaminidase